MNGPDRLASKQEPPSDFNSSDARPAGRRFFEWLDTHKHQLGVLVVLVVLALTTWALWRLIHGVSAEDVGHAIAQLPGRALIESALFTAGGFLALVGYDWSALHYVGRRLPLRTVAYASFCGFAIGNSVGLSFLSGGSVRFRIYSEAGVPSDEIVRVVIFCIIAFGFGVCAVSALGVAARPDLLAEWLGISRSWLTAASAFAIAGIAGWIALCSRTRSFGVGQMTVPMPSVSLVVVQLLISALDIGFASAALYALLPPHQEFGFIGFVPLYCVAAVAGVMSHVPGGLGVFEAVILFALGDVVPLHQLVGVLTVYRLMYYGLPLLLAALLLSGGEVRRQIGRRRSVAPGEQPNER